jgi:hypothetical protein
MRYNRSIVELNREHLKKMIGEISIAEYFQIIPATGSLQFNIDFTKDGRYKFSITYKTKYFPKYDFVNLPVELNDIIHSYLEDYIVLEFMVDLRYDFPFSRPVWSLMKVDDSYNNRVPICLFEYYKHIVKLHNKMYIIKNNWSPSMGIKSDILKFICRINHFEVFADY